MDELTFKKTFPKSNPEPMPSNLCFKNADGSPLCMIGFYKTKFWIGKGNIEDDIYICKGLTKTRLLGASFLKKFSKWGVDNNAGVFVADGVTIPLISIYGNPPSICSVQTQNTVNVPPRCSRFIKAALPYRFKASEFMFKPCKNLFQKKKLLVPACLVANDIFDGTVTIKLTNPTYETIVLGKGTKLGKTFTNLDDYVISEEGFEGSEVIIGSVSTEDMKGLEEKLKKENKDLYDLYQDAGEIIQGKERYQLLKLLYTYKEAFSRNEHDIGTTNIIKHRIIPKSKEIVYRRQYRLSDEQHKQMEDEVEKLLHSGVVKESMSPYNNPVLMVPKKEAGKWRFCLDCRYINDLTENQYFPLPRVDDTIDSLSGASIFSVVDMTSGYHQVELEEESSEMCAFSTRKGHYQYTKMPMGLRGSGMTFQKMVTLLMSGMLHTDVLAYLDDCILYGTNVSQHLATLEEVLHRFCKAGLKLKPRKCKLFQKELVYLGFLVNANGVQPNPEKTELIKNLPSPSCVNEVQVFLGKVNYYRKFIPKLAEIAHPLYELLEKNKKKFIWDSEQEEAFVKLKTILCSNQVMIHPQLDKDFILDVDASDYGLGVELSQKDINGDERPVAYGSRHLEKSERSYSATARETLAAVFGCEHFKQYLQGRKFILRSDHNPLVWLRAMREPKRPYSSWLVRLEQFQYEIQYRPGSQHTNADFNSRVGHTEKKKMFKSTGTQTCTEKINSGNRPRTQENKNNHRVQKTRQGDRNMRDSFVGNVEPEKPDKATCEENRNPNIETEEMEEGNYYDQNVELSPSTDLLAKLQVEDSDIGPVIKKIQGLHGDFNLTEKGEYLWKIRDKLVMKDDLLVRLQRVKAGLEPIEQVILPQCLKRMVLESLHDSELTGHFGVKRTMARVRLRYYWPGYLADVDKWCKSCKTCQERKDPTSKNTAPLTNIETGDGPFEKVALDILKLPPTSRGYRYLLVIQDYFSKWVEAFPLRRTEAPSIAQCMLNGWVSRFGCPYSVLSDQGPEFESHLFRCLNETLGVKKLRTTTYHPRTDGMVERGNRSILDILSKYTNQEKDWDLRIPLVLFAIRTSEHATTGFSPFRLTYGREAKLPWDICYGLAPNTPLPYVDWVAERKKEMSKIFQLVKETTRRNQMHQKNFFDKNLKGHFRTFKPDDLVMYCDPARKERGGKLDRPWTGPHVIKEKFSDALYKIVLDKNKETMVNVERLKKYYPREDDPITDEKSTVSDSEDEDDTDMPPTPVQDQPQNQAPEPDNDLQVEGREVRGPRQGPLMREGGRFWSNVHPSNILEGPRVRQTRPPNEGRREIME